MSRKKFIRRKVFFVLFVILVLSSLIVEASVQESVSGFFLKVWDFEPTYNKNPRAWDFIFFALIFNILAWIGLQKAFKDHGVANYILAAVIGAVLGLAAISAGMSVGFFIPFVKNIFFFMIAGLIFYVFAFVFEMGKVWAFILALVITFVAFNVFGLFEDVDASGQIDRLIPDPGLDGIDKELIKIASKNGIDISGEEDLISRLTLLQVELNKKIGLAKRGGAEYNRLVSERNRVDYLIRRAKLLTDKKSEEDALALANKVGPYNDAIRGIDAMGDSEKKLDEINKWLKKVQSELERIESGASGSGSSGSGVTGGGVSGDTGSGKGSSDTGEVNLASVTVSSLAQMSIDEVNVVLAATSKGWTKEHHDRYDQITGEIIGEHVRKMVEVRNTNMNPTPEVYREIGKELAKTDLPNAKIIGLIFEDAGRRLSEGRTLPNI